MLKVWRKENCRLILTEARQEAPVVHKNARQEHFLTCILIVVVATTTNATFEPTEPHRVCSF